VLVDKRIKLDQNFKTSFIGEMIKVGNNMKTTERVKDLITFL